MHFEYTRDNYNAYIKGRHKEGERIVNDLMGSKMSDSYFWFILPEEKHLICMKTDNLL